MKLDVIDELNFDLYVELELIKVDKTFSDEEKLDLIKNNVMSHLFQKLDEIIDDVQLLIS